ncbi:MAG: hypothetical protein JNL87_10700 [Burkholderiaceae bacterium]|nr:hypothetical protein [Burkholderiaceae bacterium]
MKLGDDLGLLSRTRPPQPARGVIARPRLQAQCDLVRNRLLTLVTAPPGYGKTSVALGWCHALAGDGACVAWLRLGPDDNHAERFLGVLAVALRRACGSEDRFDMPWAPGDLSIPAPQRLEWLLELVASQGRTVVLFIDNAHELQSAAPLHALSTLLSFAPEEFHLVLIGRAELALPLASLRAQDAVLDVPAEALRFDLVETEQLLRKSRSAAVDTEQAAQLQAYTGGWIAAMRAALLTWQVAPGPGLQGTPGLPGIGTGTPLKSVQALFNELLQQLPAATLEFIEQLSIADRMCPALAVHLTGRAEASELLDALERQQLFITPLDDEGWTEFHPLFRDFVRRRAQGRDAPRRVALHRAAAAWFAERSLWADAIEHALAGADNAQALAWIEQQAMTLVGAGDLLTLLAWERQLRAHLVQSPRRLRLAFAWSLSLAMACDRALALLDGVEAELDTDPVDAAAAPWRDECLALRAVLVANTGDNEFAAEIAARVRGGAGQPPWVANAVRNVVAAAHLHAGRWRHLYGTAPLVGVARTGARPGDPMSIDYRLSIHGLAEFRQGHLDDASMQLEQAMAMARRAERGPQSRVLAALPAPTLAMVRYEQDRVAEAARINAEHFDVNRRVGPIEGLYFAYLLAARAARLDGQAVRARYLLDEGECIAAARGWRRAVVALRLERLRMCLLDGRIAEGGAAVDGIAAMAHPGPGRPALECRDFAQAADVARGWHALVDGRAEMAIEPLVRSRDSAAASGRQLDVILLDTSLALAHHASGAKPAALEHLLLACRAALAVGALRSMVDQPAPLQPLLQLWLARRRELAPDEALDALVQRLLNAAGAGTARRGAASLIETLSPRELHILKLVADGQSNKEIARGLGIAPETVKTHVSKVFGKLGASNRAQAAAMIANG